MVNLLCRLQSASESQISSLVRKAISSQDLPDFQIAAGKMVRGLLDRCQSDPKFYPQNALIELLETTKLSYRCVLAVSGHMTIYTMLLIIMFY